MVHLGMHRILQDTPLHKALGIDEIRKEQIVDKAGYMVDESLVMNNRLRNLDADNE